MNDAMLNYILDPVTPERIDARGTRGGVATPSLRDAYNLESERARSLKQDGYIICGLIVDGGLADYKNAAHTLFEIFSSEKVFPVMLCAEELMVWRRYGFAVEWYSPDIPTADRWLNDIRVAWGMDLVTDLQLFIAASKRRHESSARLTPS